MDVAQATANLKSSDAAVRAAAAEQLAHLEDGAQAAGPALAVATADGDESVRAVGHRRARVTRTASGRRHRGTRQIASRHAAGCRLLGGHILGRLGDGAGDAKTVTALITALNSHPEAAVRERAAWALGQVGPGALAALPALQAVGGTTNPRLSRLAKQAIEQISAK